MKAHAALRRDWKLVQNFITGEEEAALVKELSPMLEKMPWNCNHLDQAIYNYRETLISTTQNYPTLHRLAERQIFPMFQRLQKSLLPIHVLDLNATGRILKHVDNIHVPRWQEPSLTVLVLGILDRGPVTAVAMHDAIHTW